MLYDVTMFTLNSKTKFENITSLNIITLPALVDKHAYEVNVCVCVCMYVHIHAEECTIHILNPNLLLQKQYNHVHLIYHYTSIFWHNWLFYYANNKSYIMTRIIMIHLTMQALASEI